MTSADRSAVWRTRLAALAVAVGGMVALAELVLARRWVAAGFVTVTLVQGALHWRAAQPGLEADRLASLLVLTAGLSVILAAPH